MPNAHPDLWQRYQATKAASTAKYARDIAAEMGISEAELTAARLGHDAVRLNDDARALIAALERVGETKCICRNEYAVHEQVGQFTHQHLSGHAGLVLNPRALDLRLFLSQWASAFHLNDNGRQSIQFFDHHGDALLKVYATTQTDMAAWETLIAEYRVAAPAPLTLRPLEPVRQEGNEIMIFVGNRGCVQIFTGALEKLAPMRGWLNIFNTTFTLHLREESLDEVWVTRKPTSDGHVTSVELFAKDGTQIAQLYGQRSEGHPEQTQWRQQVDRLTREGQPA